VPDGSSAIEYSPIVFPGDRQADFATRSAFVNDRLILGTHLTLNLGLRYDANRGHDSIGTLQADDSRFSPRIGGTWDLFGNGAERINASVSRYASKVQQPIGAAASPANIPAFVVFFYDGPEINVDPTMPVSNPEVLRQVFAWFASVGGVNNKDLLAGGSYPGATQIRGHLVSPIVDEYTVGYGHQFGDHGLVRGDYIHRRWSDFYVKDLTTANGKVTSPYGDVLDRIFISNGNEGLSRRYRGAILQGSYRSSHRFSLGGNYTWSKLTGNVEGENAGSSAVPVQSPSAYEPEYLAFAQNSPVGYLSGDIRHRANLWAAHEIPTRFGQFTLTLLQRYQSARSYSAVASIDVRGIKNPGYALAPALASYYLFGRGQLRVDPVSSTGAGLNFATVLGRSQLFAEADVENIFNRHAVEDPSFVNRGITTGRTDRNLASFNPFTTQPVGCPQGVRTSSAQCKGITNYQLSAVFGKPTGQAAYQTPRTVRLSLGVRF
ncbi:MAG: TonB-dependent receptor, partial [Acidobacteria bacterium]|nr:TonB-dependent receptor [Acidobacteriota bacterium]